MVYKHGIRCPNRVTLKLLIDWRRRSFMPSMPSSPAAAGLAVLVEIQGDSYSTRILFDTATSGKLLRASAERLSVDLKTLDLVVLSHWHIDHSGGLPYLMKVSRAPVYAPPKGTGFNPVDGFTALRLPRKPVIVKGPLDLGNCVYTTGPLEGYFPFPPLKVREQALAVKLSDGRLVVLIGCSHPKPQRLVEKALAVSSANRVALLMGGLHAMFPATRREVERNIAALVSMPIDRIAPIHCSGSLGLKLSRRYFSARVIEVQAGDELVIEAGKDVVAHVRG